ncbi:MAG: chemotaxis protein CheX [bacterium]
MSEDILQKEDLLQDFVDSTIDVLTTMSGLDVTYDGMRKIDGVVDGLGITACMDITGVLGFSGGRRGSVLITFSDAIALKAIGGMLGMEFTEVDADVRDGVGELVNMIAGGAKTKLQNKGIDFELSIPNTVIGSNHKITAPAATTRTRLDFGTPHGKFFIEVYLKRDDS